MPLLALHMAIAREVADCLRHRLLDQERGNLYLGSTAPDVWAIARCGRERTHFFALGALDEQSGVASLFRAYPRLARPGALNRPTVAFVAGYLTHLVVDETWITDIYRPFFGERSPLGGDRQANVRDRALQFSLDEEKRRDRALTAHVREEVSRSNPAVEIDFIEADTLRRWQALILQTVNRPPSWDDFRYLAGWRLREAGIESGEAFQRFLHSLPDLVEETLRYVTPERLQAFMEDSLDRSIEVVREYLACA